MRGVTINFKHTYTPFQRFQLTRLMRGVTNSSVLLEYCPNISTHTPHARRDQARVGFFPFNEISTHTPHARRDFKTVTP